MNLGGVGRDSQGGHISLVRAGVLAMLYLHGEESQVPGHMTSPRIAEVGGQGCEPGHGSTEQGGKDPYSCLSQE